MSYFINKVVLITGGSAGLGRSIAEAFARVGARVIITARELPRLETVAAQLRDQGGEITAIGADVTRREQVITLFARIKDQYGRLDVLVNNAGRSTRGLASETTPEQFQQLFDLNFLGMVRCTQAALPYLARSGGHLVNIGSLASKVATQYLAAYPVSKFAVAAYSQQLRLELVDKGIHVLLVCPGPLVREDSGDRYDGQVEGLPETARRPAGGARVKAVSPKRLAGQIVRACEQRRPELVVPAKALAGSDQSALAVGWGLDPAEGDGEGRLEHATWRGVACDRLTQQGTSYSRSAPPAAGLREGADSFMLRRRNTFA